MYAFVQLSTILLMTAVTFVLLLAFGPARRALLYTREEKQQWDQMIGNRTGSWLTSTNIVGTLTSFATVFIFFIEYARKLGWLLLVGLATMWCGAAVTNWFTAHVSSRKRIRDLLGSNEQLGGVVATIFWADDPESQRTSQIIKWISLLNIAGFIWLDFAVFAKIARSLVATNVPETVAIVLFACGGIFYFTLRYGIRGFVFVDIFHVPMIALGASIFLFGCLLAFRQAPQPITLDLLKPTLPAGASLIFILHVAIVNLFIGAVTEPHWLRVWIFRAKETKLQVRSLGFTVLLSLVIIVIGLTGYLIAPDRATGIVDITALLSKVRQLSFVYPVAFWIAAMAALFSSADSQIYSWLVVKQFDARTGRLREREMQTIKPLASSIAMVGMFAAVYVWMQQLGLPQEKVIFILLPVSMTTLPAFARAIRGLPQKPVYIIMSLVSYFACSMWGLHQPDGQLLWNLAAVALPLLTAVIAAFGKVTTHEGKEALLGMA
jgi:hypothetical protein